MELVWLQLHINSNFLLVLIKFSLQLYLGDSKIPTACLDPWLNYINVGGNKWIQVD